jgi:alpha-galactosidase
MTKFRYNNTDAYPLIDKWINEESVNFWNRKKNRSKDWQQFWSLTPKKIDLYSRFGIMPIGDTGGPGGGSWGWWYHYDKKIEKHWKEKPFKWFLEYIAGGKKDVDKIEKILNNSELKVTGYFKPLKSEENIINIIDSLEFNIKREIIVNILNKKEYVKGIPEDFQVEIPAIVDGKGIHGKKVTELPKPILSYILRDRVAPVELEIEAFIKKSRELLLHLILMDPWTKSEAQAKNLLEDIFKLPYHQQLREHYA